ncbi:hypothetical protein BR93DRAFT_2592 [Coniochaeta sp. PMI_546]|nr:hypothetical protein BR93DRAFT_2592 [Coniochaeta sp. PMI_546]
MSISFHTTISSTSSTTRPDRVSKQIQAQQKRKPRPKLSRPNRKRKVVIKSSSSFTPPPPPPPPLPPLIIIIIPILDSIPSPPSPPPLPFPLRHPLLTTRLATAVKQAPTQYPAQQAQQTAPPLDHARDLLHDPLHLPVVRACHAPLARHVPPSGARGAVHEVAPAGVHPRDGRPLERSPLRVEPVRQELDHVLLLLVRVRGVRPVGGPVGGGVREAAAAAAGWEGRGGDQLAVAAAARLGVRGGFVEVLRVGLVFPGYFLVVLLQGPRRLGRQRDEHYGFGGGVVFAFGGFGCEGRRSSSGRLGEGLYTICFCKFVSTEHTRERKKR